MKTSQWSGSSLVRIGLVGASVTWMVACDMIPGMGAPGPEIVEEAQETLSSGDLPGAAAQYSTLAGENPGSIEVAVGQAYMQVLQGDLDGADATLAATEEAAGERLSEVKMRRAIIARQQKDFEAMKEHGLASGMPAGRLLAAELHLINLESDEAAAILRELTGEAGRVGDTASEYLKMLDSGDQILTGLAEATALWSLGDRGPASSSAEELVKGLPEDDESKPSRILLWAGRAATSGEAAVASSLLDELSFPPEGQAWRVQATRAIIAAAEGEVEESIRILNALQAGGAPQDGLADARATACALVDDKNKAKEIVGDLESPAVARCLARAGALQVAPGRAPDGPLKTFLENQ